MQLSQEQVEGNLSDVLPHGCRETIAKGTGIHNKIVAAYFNPNDERKSPHFETLHIQAVLDSRRPEIGDAVWSQMCAMRDASRPANASGMSPIEVLIAKISSDADTSTALAAALEDGKIDKVERVKLMGLILRGRELYDQIEKMVLGSE